ncbi:uncharacterized protein B0T23DRAFT_384213 [Neurospora hispaniola]|uniref:DUF3752 domain-containing protein n=1 Tax=Neurospora hispaniola TaxID=588809 RepID=A0AAJ0I3K3_9PEZI|nr:hypothetical protein B0T23DRAFT_384213 [Neurospora hispaniola]
MASIGPQLPPHLQKRKRDSKDKESASPPTKISRPDSNPDELPLDDDDSDNDFGPSAPNPNRSYSASSIGPSAAPPRPSIGPFPPPSPSEEDEKSVAKPTTQPIGPSLPPPPPTTTNIDEIPLEDSDDDDIGPAIGSSIGPTAHPASAASAAPKRIYGPAFPPADLSERPTTDPNADSDSNSDSDSDDGYGPALPGSRSAASSKNSHGSGPPFPSFAQQQDRAEELQTPKRDDWMIAPPTSSSYRAPDPTKLKSRKFASGRSAATEKLSGVSSIWTETPEEKIKRLAAAVLGREDPSSTAASSYSSSKIASVSNTVGPKNLDEERVRSYTEQTRGRSLVEEHQAAIAAGKRKLTSSSSAPSRPANKYGKQDIDDEDDPSKRVFDREKDMAVGGRISHTQRKDLLNRAANFGDRFQSGKYL